MLTVYIASMVFALVLIGAAVFLGGDGHDTGGAHDAPGDTHAELGSHAHGGEVHPHVSGNARAPHATGSGSIFLPFLSIRFWTYTLGAFGMSGLLLLLLDAPLRLHLPVAAACGVGAGLLVTWVLRALGRRAVSSPTSLAELRGAEGTVMLPIGPGKEGKVRLRLGGQEVEVLARTQDEATLQLHDKVLVIDVNGATVEVTRATWESPAGAEEKG